MHRTLTLRIKKYKINCRKKIHFPNPCLGAGKRNVEADKADMVGADNTVQEISLYVHLKMVTTPSLHNYR
jgi:hypothetical protein